MPPYCHRDPLAALLTRLRPIAALAYAAIACATLMPAHSQTGENPAPQALPSAPVKPARKADAASGPQDAQQPARKNGQKAGQSAKPKTAAKPSAKPPSKPTAKSDRPAGRAAATSGVPYTGRDDAMQWAGEMAQRQAIDPAWAKRMLGQARLQPAVVRLIQPPAPGARKNWAAYRARFIDGRRISAGLRFWEQHRAAFERAEREFGVSADIIASIIGVETLYGQHMGQFRVLDALATLSFDHPPEHPRLAERVAFFRGELEQFLALAHRSGGDPQLPLGSFAGAMGLPQFMPSSWIRWGVDFDGDGRVDLRNSPADAIGSVANYFKVHGWQPGLPTHFPVAFDTARVDMDALLAPDILPTFSTTRFQALGAVIEGPALSHSGPLALVELQNGEAPNSYVAGTENFYAITRYNQSSYYAMAVIDLAQALREARGQSAGPAGAASQPAPAQSR